MKRYIHVLFILALIAPYGSTALHQLVAGYPTFSGPIFDFKISTLVFYLWCTLPSAVLYFSAWIGHQRSFDAVCAAIVVLFAFLAFITPSVEMILVWAILESLLAIAAFYIGLTIGWSAGWQRQNNENSKTY